jgi:hypothetical protein
MSQEQELNIDQQLKEFAIEQLAAMDPPTPYQQCLRDHVGEAGYCDSSGNWHPKV